MEVYIVPGSPPNLKLIEGGNNMDKLAKRYKDKYNQEVNAKRNMYNRLKRYDKLKKAVESEDSVYVNQLLEDINESNKNYKLLI